MPAEGAGRGANYGWSIMEGSQCFRGSGMRSDGPDPARRWSTTTPEGCSVTGGYVYRGSAIPALQGHYFYADLLPGMGRSFRYAGGAVTDETSWPIAAARRDRSSASARTQPGSCTYSRPGDGVLQDRARALGLHELTPRARRSWIAPDFERLGSTNSADGAVRDLDLELPGLARDWSTIGTTARRAPRQRCWRSTPRFPLFGQSESTRPSTRPPTEEVLRGYAEHLPPGFPCREQGLEPAHRPHLHQGSGPGPGRKGQP